MAEGSAGGRGWGIEDGMRRLLPHDEEPVAAGAIKGANALEELLFRDREQRLSLPVGKGRPELPHFGINGGLGLLRSCVEVLLRCQLVIDIISDE